MDTYTYYMYINIHIQLLYTCTFRQSLTIYNRMTTDSQVITIDLKILVSCLVFGAANCGLFKPVTRKSGVVAHSERGGNSSEIKLLICNMGSNPSALVIMKHAFLKRKQRWNS